MTSTRTNHGLLPGDLVTNRNGNTVEFVVALKRWAWLGMWCNHNGTAIEWDDVPTKPKIESRL